MATHSLVVRAVLCAVALVVGCASGKSATPDAGAAGAGAAGVGAAGAGAAGAGAAGVGAAGAGGTHIGFDGAAGAGGPTDGSAPDARDSAGADAGVGSVDVPAPPGALVWRVINPPQLGVEAIRAIWGSGPNDVYAGSDLGMIYHLGKTGTWTQHDLKAKVNTIWGSGPNDVYVGTDTMGVLHSTGDDTWLPVVLPVGTATAISGVWGTAATDVYAVGAAGILHLSKGAWASEGDPGGRALYGVWGSGATDVYVVKSGGDTVWRSAGDGSWAPEFTKAPNLTASLWGSSANDVYMTLEPYNLTMGPTLVIHSTGKGDWMTQLSVDSQQLASVWGSGPRDVYAAGVHMNASNIPDSAVLYHTGGDGHWTPVTGVPSVDVIYCVGGTGPGDVYLGALTFDFKGVLIHGTAP